ncbi:MAG: hypothetical protein V3V99_04320 [candidate division Zixibacteria bacterium]
MLTFIKIISAIAIIAVTLYGCTILGLGIGAVVDAGKPDYRSIPGWDLHAVKPGSYMKLYLMRGDSLSGEFMGLSSERTSDYGKKIERLKADHEDTLLLPELNEVFDIYLKSGHNLKKRFLGFDILYTSMKIPKGENPQSRYPDLYCLVVQNISDSATTKLFIREIDSLVDPNGKSIPGANFTSAAFSNRLPLLSSITIRDGNNVYSTPLDEIQSIDIPRSKNAKWYGMGIGFLVDVTAVILIAATWDGMGSGATIETSGDGVMSCPFVYSYDGVDYRIDSEPLATAIFETAQRDDWDNLRFLREVEGQYRIRVTNELDETQHIDQMMLYIIDCDEGQQAIPSYDGYISIINNPQPPISAVDFGGNEVLSMIETDDEKMWISSPFNFDPDDDSQIRNGIICEFNKPDNITEATMVFSLRNTYWSGHLLGKFLSLHGHQIDEWYETINTSQDARNQFYGAVRRETMLQFDIWDGTTWRTHDFIPDVGIAVNKEVAIPINLENISGDNLKIKLESTVGIWAVNSVGVDFSDYEPYTPIEFRPRSAVDQDGNDITELLLHKDKKYYHMPTNDDRAEIVFDAWPLPEGKSRSILLKTNGYYNIKVSGQGEPSRELISNMLNEKGAFGKYSLRLLNKYLQNALLHKNTIEEKDEG